MQSFDMRCNKIKEQMCTCNFFMCKTWYGKKNAPNIKGTQKKIKAISINKPFVTKHQGNIGPSCPSTWWWHLQKGNCQSCIYSKAINICGSINITVYKCWLPVEMEVYVWLLLMKEGRGRVAITTGSHLAIFSHRKKNAARHRPLIARTLGPQEIHNECQLPDDQLIMHSGFNGKWIVVERSQVQEIWNHKFFYDVRCTAFEWRGGNNSEYFSLSMIKMCKVFSWEWMWWSRSGSAQIIGFCDPLFAMRLFECIYDAQVTVCCFEYLCEKRFPPLLHLRTLNPFSSS